MKTSVTPIVFLGLADRVISDGDQPFLYSKTSLVNLGIIKSYIIYPLSLEKSHYLFLIHSSFLADFFSGSYDLIFKKEKKQLYVATATALISEKKGMDFGEHGFLKNPEWEMFGIPGAFLIEEPGIVSIFLRKKGEEEETFIADIFFNYSPEEKRSAENLYGLKSRLISFKKAQIELQCTQCSDALTTYTGIERDLAEEKKGSIWQEDLPEKFECKCGAASVPLKYYKESMHSLLMSEHLPSENAVRASLYSTTEVKTTVEKFFELITKEKGENKVQSFIEENPIMLCMFNAKKLFKKTDIIGLFQTDFAILDANDNLIFIEIERPEIKLFKKNGHPTAELMHAYAQVEDWLHEMRSSKKQVLERMKLDGNSINQITGFVIAGIRDNENKYFYTKHQQKNENNKIGFISFDELASAVLNLVKAVK